MPEAVRPPKVSLLFGRGPDRHGTVCSMLRDGWWSRPAMFAWYPSSPWPKKARPSQFFRDAVLQSPPIQCVRPTGPLVRLRPALPREIRNLGEAAALVHSVLRLQPLKPRPEAHRPKRYDSSFLLLFSPAS